MSRELFSNWGCGVIDVLLMCRNHFYTLPLICYNISNKASIEVKMITSSSQIRIQVPGSCFLYWFAHKFLGAYRYMYVLHSLFAALPYLETGHACGSVKPWDPATISWIKLPVVHTPNLVTGRLSEAQQSITGTVALDSDRETDQSRALN